MLGFLEKFVFNDFVDLGRLTDSKYSVRGSDKFGNIKIFLIGCEYFHRKIFDRRFTAIYEMLCNALIV